MIELSDEQNLICQSNSNEIKVNAFAGTGKTTTLLHYSLQRPNKRILYICYNKTIQLEAEAKFPKNVVKKTSHSLAYGYVGFKYKHKLASFVSNLAIKNYLKLQNSKNPDVAAKILMSTVENFCSSKSYQFETNHLPYDILSMSGIIDPNYSTDHIEKIESAILHRAHILWSLMCDTNNTDISMTHDGYLKLFQLNIKQLPYEVVMLDEAQDANPATLAILEAQNNCQKILVGDSYQSIYSFRGAINAMETFKNAEQFYLTQSFRFGETVANYANSILSMMGEQRQIKGMGKSEIVSKAPMDKFTLDKSTVIFRNNNSVFSYAIENLKGRKVFMEGGISNYNLDSLLDVYYMYSKQTNKIKDPLIASFSSFDKLFDSATINNNIQLLNHCSLVKKYGYNFQSRVNDLRNRITKTSDEADIVLTNVHKAKGKEYNRLELSEDFYSSPIDGKSYNRWLQAQSHQHAPGTPEYLNIMKTIADYQKYHIIHHIPDDIKEEAHVAYVALTRVKNKVILPYNYNNYLNISFKLFNEGITPENNSLMVKLNFKVTDEAKAKISKYRLDKIIVEKPTNEPKQHKKLNKI